MDNEDLRQDDLEAVENLSADGEGVEDQDDDVDSILSDVDEAQFEDFDPNQIAIEDKPVIAVDEENVKLLGRHKRKRDEDEIEKDAERKRKKGLKREKQRKERRVSDSDDDFSGGNEVEGKRRSKTKSSGESLGRASKQRALDSANEATSRKVYDDADLDPEERRKRALDRAMDAALKGPAKRRRKAGDIDLNSMADDEIAALRIRMAEAAEADVKARNETPPRPAMQKLRLLPEVSALLNRNNRDVESAIVDPETNLLESVRFFLEPLSDGSLPAYNIQRELFSALGRLPIDKESLISSGLGKVVLFYTKSRKPETTIKRTAERLLAEWTRPILKRSDDYRKRELDIADFDPSFAQTSNVARVPKDLDRSAIVKAETLALSRKSNRARAEVEAKTYTVVPRNTHVTGGAFARPLGASGEDAFRRMKARQQALTGQKRAVR